MKKDAILDRLAYGGNVAQFVSFNPELEQGFSRIFGYQANHKFKSIDRAIETLLENAPEESINVRSYNPDSPQGNEFHYGIKDQNVAISHITRLAGQGLHTIINETIDVNDGGVSGVIQGDCIEFAPGEIPRFVDKSSKDPIPALPLKLGLKLLETVYGFEPELTPDQGQRIEFSIHPSPRGWQHSNTILWEQEYVKSNIEPFYSWPNSFSRLIGDKAYGLLMAHLLNAPTPRTTVFPRNSKLGIFTFGTATGAENYWTRTCPIVQEPGKFTTLQGWHDPFSIMNKDDPEEASIASCLVQEEVQAQYSGAAITGSDGKLIIEGVAGFGDKFMQGDDKPTDLPLRIKKAIKLTYQHLSDIIGPVRFEWAFDGHKVWILQLHKGTSESSGRIIYPGTTNNWKTFNVDQGLAALRHLVADAATDNFGIKVIGNIGMSSHVADVLRKAKIPSQLT